MFKTAWRAGLGLAVSCVFASLGTSFFGLVYPLGFRAVVNGATGHHQATVIAGVVVAVVVALSVAASWALTIIRASLNSRLTDQANLALSFRLGKLVTAAPYHVALARGLMREAPLVVVLER